MASLRVAHVGDCNASLANGVAQAVWWIAAGQVSAGARVFVYRIGERRVNDEPIDGVTRRTFPADLPLGCSRQLARWIAKNNDAVDLIHFHSVFIPRHAMLARACRASGMPYVTAPHGGYAREVFRRGRLKKAVYTRLIERPMLHGAAGVHCVARREFDDIRRLGYQGPLAAVANPFDLEPLARAEPAPTPRVVYLGRWDIQHKGLDRLLRIWKRVEARLDGFQLDLYGPRERSDTIRRLRDNLGVRTARVHEPVFGDAKLRVLSRAALYVQCSRWEVFGVSIAEAMAAGVPIALTAGCYITDSIVEADAGLVLPEDEALAAQAIVELLRDPTRCRRLGDNGRRFACERFEPAAVGRELADFYRHILAA